MNNGNAIYVASHRKDGGVYFCEIDSNGVINASAFVPMDRPSWLCMDGTHLYALLRETYMMHSGIQPLRLLADGRPVIDGEIIPVHGAVSAHIMSHKGELYCANYLTGTTIKLPGKLLAHHGSGPNRERQPCSHPHYVTPSPDGDQIFICDLGTDSIHVCTLELEPLYDIPFPPGSGPRHMVFSHDGEYAWCVCELTSSTAVLRKETGRYKLTRVYSNVPEDYSGENAGAAIRVSEDGNRLYVSNRGHGSVKVYEPKGESLQELGYIDCGNGALLREINLIGQWLLCADDNLGQIHVYRQEEVLSNHPVSSFPIANPWCITGA